MKQPTVGFSCNESELVTWTTSGSLWGGWTIFLI